MEYSLIYLYLYQCYKGYGFTWYIDQSLIMPTTLITKACVLLKDRSLETD